MQAQALRSGADGLLTKPISEEQLIAAARPQIETAREIDAQRSRDSLTGMLKHASIKEAVDLEVKHALRRGTPVTLARLDIDDFKLVNDTYGHAARDIVISSVAMLLQQRLRQSDITGRYGREEFVAVHPI